MRLIAADRSPVDEQPTSLDARARERSTAAARRGIDRHGADQAPLPRAHPGAARAPGSSTRSRSTSTRARAARRASPAATTSTASTTARSGAPSASCTAARAAAPAQQTVTIGVPPLRRAGVHERLPGRAPTRRTRSPASSSTSTISASAASTARFMCPYEVPQVQRGARHRAQVRHVQRAARARRGAGVRAGLPQRGDRASRVVDRRRRSRTAQGDAFLPGAPSPAITMPTTVYKTRAAAAAQPAAGRLLQVAPAHRIRRSWSCWCLTQLSVGAFVHRRCSARDRRRSARGAAVARGRWRSSLGLVALGASVFHLGRPLFAFRAVLGLRTSWMSREIVAFGVVRGARRCATRAAASPARGARWSRDALELATAAASASLGVGCSVMIYARRAARGGVRRPPASSSS